MLFTGPSPVSHRSPWYTDPPARLSAYNTTGRISVWESPPTVADLSEDEIHHVRSKLERRDGPLTFSDFPQRLCSAVRSHVEASTSFEHDLLADLKRCFEHHLCIGVAIVGATGRHDGGNGCQPG